MTAAWNGLLNKKESRRKANFILHIANANKKGAKRNKTELRHLIRLPKET